MGMLQVSNIGLSFGDRTLLENVSLTLGEHARCALAGGNGEGKSTLMKIICGSIQPDSGTITRTKGMVVSYLPQSDIVLRENTVYREIEKAFDVWQRNIDRQREIEAQLQSSSNRALLEELARLQEELLNGPYYRREAIITSIAGGLGLSHADLSRPCSQFSGGYQMRIALASVLALDPDVMMLDEPTNYLDIEARIWLRNYLKTYRGSLMIVCHDRAFLDDTVNEVCELFNAKLTHYSGNYSAYEKKRLLEIEQLEKAWAAQQAEMERTQQFIERFRYKASKARQVQSRIKAMEKLEPVVVPSHLKVLNFSFPDPGHSPNDMVMIENLTKRYADNVIFDGFSLHVPKGMRLAVTGHNGVGKSTLLRIIAGHDVDYGGSVRLGPGVSTGYYSQDTADSLDMEGTVFSQVGQYAGEGAIRNALGAFLFSGDDVFKKVSVLSGGERSRLALLEILLRPANLLILDEPTNHLDINSKTMLLNALKRYTGTVVFVSHDADFIRELATAILYMDEDGPQFINGDYDYFEYRLSLKKQYVEDKAPVPEPGGRTEQKRATPALSSSEDRALANRMRNRARKLERSCAQILEELEQAEAELANVEQKINLPENYSDSARINALVAEKNAIQLRRDELEARWLDMSAELEGLFNSPSQQ